MRPGLVVVVMTTMVLAVVAMTMTADVQVQALAMMMTTMMMMPPADEFDTRLCADLFLGHCTDRCCRSWKCQQSREGCCAKQCCQFQSVLLLRSGRGRDPHELRPSER